MRLLSALLAAALASRAAGVPTTLCVVLPAGADAAAASSAPACVTRAKYALESARDANGDFGVQGTDYTRCETCATLAARRLLALTRTAPFAAPSPPFRAFPTRRTPFRAN